MTTHLCTLTDSDVSVLMTDPSRIPGFLHIPRESFEEYWQSEEAKSLNVLTLHGTLPLIHYLTTGHLPGQAAPSTLEKGGVSPRTVVRLEHSSRRVIDFFEIIIEDLHTAIRSGTVGDETDVPLPEDKRLDELVATLGEGRLREIYAMTHIETHASREDMADYIFDAAHSRVRAGYKAAFAGPLPLPASSTIPPVTMTTGPVKRKAPGRPPSAERAAKKAKPAAEQEATPQPQADAEVAPPVLPEQQQQPQMVEAAGGVVTEGTQGQQGGVSLPPAAPLPPQIPQQGIGEAQPVEAQGMPQPAAVPLPPAPTPMEEGGEGEGGGMGAGAGEGEGEGEGAEVEVEHEVLSMPHPTRLKVKELKSELMARGLPATGRRDDLVTRLSLALFGVPVPGQELGAIKSDPVDLLLTGGVVLHHEVFAGGMARALSSMQVKELDNALQDVPEERLRENFSPERMKAEGVGPAAIYTEEDPGALWTLVSTELAELRKFLHTACDLASAVLIY